MSSEIVEWAKLRQSMGDCTECGLCRVGVGPVPLSCSPNYLRPWVCVVGEAPGRQENDARKPFVGPSGKLVRRYLSDFGINDGEIGYLNVVSCWPNRSPTRLEVNSCRHNLEAQLAFIQPQYILVLGGIALAAMLGTDTRIGLARGHWWKMTTGSGKSAWAMATWHPSAILRNVELAGEARADIELFALASLRRVEPAMNEYCVVCKDTDVEIRVKGLGYCDGCKPDGCKFD